MIGFPQMLVFDGVTGSGKSTILNYLKRCYPSKIWVGSKLTTRPGRKTDNAWEFNFVKRLPAHAKKYSYESLGYEYAVDEEQLKESNLNGLTYAITCTDAGLIRLLKTSYDAKLIYIYRLLSNRDAEKLFYDRELASNDILLRKKELEDTVTLYCESLELYNHVVLNIGDEAQMLEQVAAILRIYSIQPGTDVLSYLSLNESRYCA